MNRFNDIKNRFKKEWYFVFVGVIISLLILAAFILNLKKEVSSKIISDINYRHNILLSHIDDFKKDQHELLDMLSKNQYIKNINPDNKKDIEKLFFSVVDSKKDIMQLRYIDSSGMEIVRVDQTREGKVKVIPKHKLQNKAHRDYVEQFLKLQENQYGYSNFDLNIENKKVEVPFNPTLRMGKALYKNGKQKGILVINYFMEDWLRHISVYIPNKFILVDKDNYFMTHYLTKWEWSKYKKSKLKLRDYSGFEQFPIWQKSLKNYMDINGKYLAKRVDFFSNDVMILYKYKRSFESEIVPVILKYSIVILVSFLLVLLPVAYILYRYIQLTNEQAQFENNILNNMFDALIVIDQNAIIKNMNNSVKEIFGYEYDELIDKNINKLVPMPHHSKHDSYVANYKKEGRVVIGKDRNIEALDKYGNKIPISLAVTRFEINGKIYFTGIIRDLRDVKKLEDENKRQMQILHQQNKLAAMGEMIGAIAHQWRQPLNELSIRIQKLKYSYLKQEITQEFIDEFIQKNKKTVEFMSKTIDDFRNFFRIDKQQSQFDLKESVQEVINIQTAQLKNHHIILTLQGQSSNVFGHKNEFQQVILNLISNAKDALVSRDIKDPEILITLNKKEIKIQDNAGGIDKDILPRVFEPYFTTKDQGEGTGMGLYMSKMIIEDNMNGKIFAQNKKDGAVIIIELE